MSFDYPGPPEREPSPRPSTSAPTVYPAQPLVNGHSHQHMNLNGTVASGSTISAGQARSAGDSLPNLGEMEAKCGGCLQTIDQESGGVVVAFG